MKKSTKLLISLTSSLMIAGNVIALSSCGGGSVSGIATGDVEVVAYDGSEVTISFYHCMGANLKTILANCIKDFNEIYPNIKVQHTSFGDYPGVRDQISTEIAAGRGPSLAYCYPDHVALYNKSKAVLTLDDHIASKLEVTKADGTTDIMGMTEAQVNDYVPAYWNEGKIYGDDKMYTLPMLKSTELLYYNADYFTENNLSVPTTWDEMEAVCEQILNIENAKEGGKEKNPCIPLGYDSSANWFITMTEQLNSGYTTDTKGNYFTFNNDTNRAFVERFRGWYEKGYVTTEEIFGSYTSDLFTETAVDDPKTEKNEAKTKAYMCIGSSGGASYQCPDQLPDQSYPFEVGVAMIPQENPAEPTMISQGPNLCLFKKQNAQEVAAAWLFAKYITSTPEHQAKFSMQNGYTCAIQSVKNNDIYSMFLDSKDGNGFLQASCIELTMQFKDYYFVSPAFNGSSTARDEMGLLMKACFQEAPSKGQTAAEMIAEKFGKTYDTLKAKYDK